MTSDAAQLPPRTESFWKLVKKTDSIQEALSAFKQNSPAHFENYTLVYDSRSKQPADWMNPRVILYGTTANFVVTYNNQENLDGEEAFEIMEYLPAKGQYRFTEIIFKRSQPNLHPNPSDCESCHGYEEKPIWDNYFLWPGVYGSEDDHLTYAHTPVTGLEEKKYEEFRERKSSVPRYTLLEPLDSGAYGNESRYQTRPNAALSELFHLQSVERIAKRIARDKNLAPWRYALLALYNGPNKKCGTLPGFFPEDLRRDLDAVFRKVSAAIGASNDRSLRRKIQRHKGLVGDAVSRARALDASSTASDYYNAPWAFTKIIVEGLSDIDTREWSLVFGPAAYELDISGGISELEDALKREFAKNHDIPDYDYFTGCRILREKHLELWPKDSEKTKKTVEELISAQGESTGEQWPFSKCISCHTPERAKTTPAIPFDTPRFLASALRSSPTLGEKITERTRENPSTGVQPMPPTGPGLTATERKGIHEFVEKATASLDGDDESGSREGRETNIVEFVIPEGHGDRPWNTEENPVTIRLGQTLRIINNDPSHKHALHSFGAPCPHGGDRVYSAEGELLFEGFNIEPIPVGGWAECDFDELPDEGGFYNHFAGSTARFHVEVTESSQVAPPSDD